MINKLLLPICILLFPSTESNPLSEEASEEGEVPDYGFGQAKHFMPLPNTVVGSHCAWEIRLNTLEGRIPEIITEILCHSAGDQCGGSDYFSCKQMKARMMVAHTDQAWTLRNMRNITVNTGCSCVYREPVLLDMFRPGVEEKRRKRGSLN